MIFQISLETYLTETKMSSKHDQLQKHLEIYRNSKWKADYVVYSGHNDPNYMRLVPRSEYSSSRYEFAGRTMGPYYSAELLWEIAANYLTHEEMIRKIAPLSLMNSLLDIVIELIEQKVIA